MKKFSEGDTTGNKSDNQFSKERKFSPKGKMNSPKDEFVPLREKVIERTTSPWGRFTAPRENDAGKFGECSLRKRAFSPRVKFTPLNDKHARKVIVTREKAEGIFPKGGSGDTNPVNL